MSDYPWESTWGILMAPSHQGKLHHVVRFSHFHFSLSHQLPSSPLLLEQPSKWIWGFMLFLPSTDWHACTQFLVTTVMSGDLSHINFSQTYQTCQTCSDCRAHQRQRAYERTSERSMGIYCWTDKMSCLWSISSMLDKYTHWLNKYIWTNRGSVDRPETSQQHLRRYSFISIPHKCGYSYKSDMYYFGLWEYLMRVGTYGDQIW